jgi:hypothetical protein
MSSWPVVIRAVRQPRVRLRLKTEGGEQGEIEEVLTRVGESRCCWISEIDGAGSTGRFDLHGWQCSSEPPATGRGGGCAAGSREAPGGVVFLWLGSMPAN